MSQYCTSALHTACRSRHPKKIVRPLQIRHRCRQPRQRFDPSHPWHPNQLTPNQLHLHLTPSGSDEIQYTYKRIGTQRLPTAPRHRKHTRPSEANQSERHPYQIYLPPAAFSRKHNYNQSVLTSPRPICTKLVDLDLKSAGSVVRGCQPDKPRVKDRDGW